MAGAGRRARSSSDAGRARLAGTLLLALAVTATLLSGCAPSVQASAAQNKAKLDGELHTAQVSAGVPAILLASIRQREDALAAGIADGSDATGQAAAEGYAGLYQQVAALEQLTPAQIRQRATLDLQSLALALTQVQSQNLSVTTFQANAQQARQQLAAATSAKDLFAADGYIVDQASAVSQIIPVYHEMQALDALVGTQSKALGATTTQVACAQTNQYGPYFVSNTQMLANAGLDAKNAPTATFNTAFNFSSWPSQNQRAFQSAKTGADFAELSATVLAEISQLTADSSALLPQLTAAAAVAAFQADVQTYTADGGKNATYQQQATADQQALDAAKSLADVSAVAKAVAKHRQDFALPFLQVKAPHDMHALTDLVSKANAITIYDPSDGGRYPLAYEYTSVYHGIGDASARLANAQTLQDYQAVESEIQMFTQNVTAMMNDYAQMPKDLTKLAAWEATPHQADLDLIKYYGVQNTRVIVVSFAEQEARLYENGQLTTYSIAGDAAHDSPNLTLIPDPQGRPDAFDVTTGNPDLPSVPGIHCVMPSKVSNVEDTAPASLVGTGYWYAPTHIDYSFGYADPGYAMHDAWWRDPPDGGGMGYLSNLPHPAPLAFNNGSHGCINLHYHNEATGRYDMAIVWAFAREGTPIIVY